MGLPPPISQGNMAATVAATVTLDKIYFETLLRRAEFQASGKDLITPVDIHTVRIPKIEHDNLLRMAQEYCMTECLISSLLVFSSIMQSVPVSQNTLWQSILADSC